MHFLRLAVLYVGLGLMSNPAAADVGRLIALADGELSRIQFHDSPRTVQAPSFLDADGAEASLDDYRGKHILLNFWALWCAPLSLIHI